MSGLQIGDRVTYKGKPYYFYRVESGKYVLGNPDGTGEIVDRSEITLLPKKIQKYMSGQRVTYKTLSGTKEGIITDVQNTNQSFKYKINRSYVPQNSIIGGAKRYRKASRRRNSRKQRRYTRRR